MVLHKWALCCVPFVAASVFGGLFGVASSDALHAPSADGLHSLWGTQTYSNVMTAATQQGNAPIQAYMQRLSETEEPEIRSNRAGAWQSRNKKFLEPSSHTDPTLRKHIKALRKEIMASLRAYIDDHAGEGLPEYEITLDASWANVNPKGGINGAHVHPFAALSGAYYVACGGNSTGAPTNPCQIQLMDPRPSSAMAHMPSDVKNMLDFGVDWTLTLWPGLLLIFPSWLTHWVPPNEKVGTRMTISFNAGIQLVDKKQQKEKTKH